LFVYTCFNENPSLISLVSRYESVAWIPNVVTFIVMLGIGGKHLVLMPAPAPISAAAILSYSATVASSVLSWSTITPDYGVYHNGKASAYASQTMDGTLSLTS
jgi:purine-cytosine permease-like protein